MLPYQKEVTLDFCKKLFQAKKGVAFSDQPDLQTVHTLSWRELKMELRPYRYLQQYQHAERRKAKLRTW